MNTDVNCILVVGIDVGNIIFILHVGKCSLSLYFINNLYAIALIEMLSHMKSLYVDHGLNCILDGSSFNINTNLCHILFYLHSIYIHRCKHIDLLLCFSDIFVHSRHFLLDHIYQLKGNTVWNIHIIMEIINILQ